jgi:hypothetical protein
MGVGAAATFERLPAFRTPRQAFSRKNARFARSFCRPRLPADAGGLASKLPALGFEPSLVLRLHGGMEPSGDVPAARATEGASLTDAFGRATAPESERVVNPRNQRHGGSVRLFRQTLVGPVLFCRQDSVDEALPRLGPKVARSDDITRKS